MKKNRFFYIIAALALVAFGRYIVPNRPGCPVVETTTQIVHDFLHDTVFSTRPAKVTHKPFYQETSGENPEVVFSDDLLFDEEEDSVLIYVAKPEKEFDPFTDLGIPRGEPDSVETEYTPIFIPVEDLPANHYEQSSQKGQCKIRYVIDTKGYLENFKYTVSCPRVLRQGYRFGLSGGMMVPFHKEIPFAWYAGANFLDLEAQVVYGGGRFQYGGIGYRIRF
jgi:hypothetical protein